MTGRGCNREMADLGEGLLGLLTMGEAAARIPGRCSVAAVRRLAAAGELERIRAGRLVRITAESVEAYKQRRLSGHAEAAASGESP